jgi:hypothetical protein
MGNFHVWRPQISKSLIYNILLGVKSQFMPREKNIRGDLIKKGLDSLDVLGLALKHVIIEYVEKRDYVLDDKHAYSLAAIETDLASIFGEDAAKLIIAKVTRSIGEQDKSP